MQRASSITLKPFWYPRSLCVQWRSWSLNHHQCRYLLIKDNKQMTLGNLISKAWLNTTQIPEKSNKEAAALVTFPVLPEGSNFPSAALSQHRGVPCIYICAWRGHFVQVGGETAGRVSSKNLVLLWLPLGRGVDTPKYWLKPVNPNMEIIELNARQEFAHSYFPWQSVSLQVIQEKDLSSLLLPQGHLSVLENSKILQPFLVLIVTTDTTVVSL